MLVQAVVVPGSGTMSWTLLGDDDVPVVPVERFLAYLTDIGRSPNTVKAYAHDLKDFWCFTGLRGLDWREARLEDIGEFIAWLQLPLAGRTGAVAVLPSTAPQVTPVTVNRKLAALSAFYAHQARHGAEVGDLLALWRSDLPEGPAEAAAGPDGPRDAGDPGCLRAAAGPFLLRPAARVWLPGRGSTRPPA